MMNKKMLAATLFCFALCAAAWAQSFSMAPVNPEFHDYREQAKKPDLKMRTTDGYGLGRIPSPLDRSNMQTVPSARQSVKAPAAYDLRDHDKVTYVQNQGPYGNCWAFATYGSMESCLLPGETWDFSENNLANLHGFDPPYGGGGDYPMSCAYMARWSGPVRESDDPYSNGTNSPSGCNVRKHVQSVIFIPNKTSATDTDTMKQLIMDHGALYGAFRWDEACYNSTNYSFYNNSTNWANHAITVIGWDDNFSHTKFKTQPPGNGAWLCKNSWGKSWGNNGYFWISYYDRWIGMDGAIFQNAESTSNYNSLWSYDYLGMCSSVGYNSSTGWGANIFTASSGASLQAASFYLPRPGSYEVRVYTGVSADNPTSGTQVAQKTGSKTYAGYYTVPLDASVTLPAGRFSIVVKFSTPNYNFPIPIEYKISGYSSAASANAGESFLSADGSSWDEAKIEGGGYFNICIKGFGTGGDDPDPGPDPDPTYLQQAQTAYQESMDLDCQMAMAYAWYFYYLHLQELGDAANAQAALQNAMAWYQGAADRGMAQAWQRYYTSQDYYNAAYQYYYYGYEIDAYAYYAYYHYYMGLAYHAYYWALEQIPAARQAYAQWLELALYYWPY